MGKKGGGKSLFSVFLLKAIEWEEWEYANNEITIFWFTAIGDLDS